MPPKFWWRMGKNPRAKFVLKKVKLFKKKKSIELSLFCKDICVISELYEHTCALGCRDNYANQHFAGFPREKKKREKSTRALAPPSDFGRSYQTPAAAMSSGDRYMAYSPSPSTGPHSPHLPLADHEKYARHLSPHLWPPWFYPSFARCDDDFVLVPRWRFNWWFCGRIS